MWECTFARSCWGQLLSRLENVIQWHIHWEDNFVWRSCAGDLGFSSRYLTLCESVCNVCSMETLFRYIFESKVSYVSTFCGLWKDEVRMQLLEKGNMLINDAKQLAPTYYYYFIPILAYVRRRL